MNRYFLLLLIPAMFLYLGIFASWNAALLFLNMGLISAIMALGVNIQWGYAGLFNVGIMGFVALGGLATVLVSAAPVPAAWGAGGFRVFAGLAIGALTVAAAVYCYRRMARGWLRGRWHHRSLADRRVFPVSRSLRCRCCRNRGCEPGA